MKTIVCRNQKKNLSKKKFLGKNLITIKSKLHHLKTIFTKIKKLYLNKVYTLDTTFHVETNVNLNFRVRVLKLDDWYL